MAIDVQDLPHLLEAPSERLNIELKAWLDLSDSGHRGTLAKSLIALANHGGGVVIVGFDDNGTPDSGRPTDLSPFGQDAINGIVERFAEPGFHCTVRHVTRENDGLEYPVILVPGGHQVPIRSKRGSKGNEIQRDRYYIRRPGPASEMPQGGHEWDELIRRCIRNKTDEISSLVRDVLVGRAPEGKAPPDAEADLEQWETESTERWVDLIGKYPVDSQVRMPLGHYRVAAAIEGVDLALPQLRDAIQRANQHLTGWPPWWWPTRDEIQPYPHENIIECHIAENTVHGDAAHSDFWRVSPDGKLFLIRGYREDSLDQGRFPTIPPGTAVDLTLPIWQIGECLLFIERFAIEADAGNGAATVRTSWSGLEGRSIVSVSGRRWVHQKYIAKTDGFTKSVTVPVARIVPTLPEIVRELIGPMYALFGFFEPLPDIYAEELGRMQRRAF